MRVHGFATEEHYASHIAAIHKHLPDGLRGQMTGGSRPTLSSYAEDGDVIMVASFKDANVLAESPFRLVYVEHGAGQRYELGPEAHPDAKLYSGGPLPSNVIGCIAPRQEVADRWDVPSFAAGCPVVDDYELFGEDGVIAIGFHWNAARVCPEATNAVDHYAEALGRLVVKWRRQGLEILGHHHPRLPACSHLWKHLKVREASIDEVRRRASLLVYDNSSLPYEHAYLARNVISLNAPWFRRDVEHGLRFWSNVPGRAVDSPEELDALDLSDIPGLKDGWRAETTEFVYGKALSDGGDGLRAAAWVAQLVH